MLATNTLVYDKYASRRAEESATVQPRSEEMSLKNAKPGHLTSSRANLSSCNFSFLTTYLLSLQAVPGAGVTRAEEVLDGSSIRFRFLAMRSPAWENRRSAGSLAIRESEG